MSAAQLNSLYIGLVALQWGVANLLVLLNIRSIQTHRTSIPGYLHGQIDSEQYQKAANYSHSKLILQSIEHTVHALLLIVLVGFGAPGVIASVLDLPCVACNGIAMLMVFGVLFMVVSTIFGSIRRFGIEDRFGFNRSTVRLFLSDTLKRALLSISIGVPVAFGVLSFIRFGGPLWWLWAALSLAFVQIGLAVIYPAVIAPMFNTFTPLPEGSLRSRLTQLAQTLDFPVSEVHVMDASRRSGHGNAYFTGIGRTRRIVLYDTLLSTVPDDEALAVVAHEIGHRKLGHVVKGLLMSFAGSLVGFYVLGRLVQFQPLFGAFGFEHASAAGLLVIVVYFSGPLFFFLAPAMSLWSRRHEFEADRFAARAMGSPDPLAAALLDLSRENLVNYTPSRAYAAFHYSHPVLSERLAALDSEVAQ